MWRQRIDSTASRTRATFVVESLSVTRSASEKVASPSSAQRRWQALLEARSGAGPIDGAMILASGASASMARPSHVCHLRCRSVNMTRSRQ